MSEHAAPPEGADFGHDFARALDAADPLRPYRDWFVYADDTIYLDGNSLGRLPKGTPARLQEVVGDQWGRSLIRSWPRWTEFATAVGDRLGREVLGVDDGQVAISDSTTVNLYKLINAALDLRPDRRTILIEKDNFPTDLYVVQGIAQARGITCVYLDSDIDRGVDVSLVADALSDDVALVVLSHVAYRSGALADMVSITAAAHEAGALTLWDLCHSAGSVRIPLREATADFAVGCTYKYLNAGPGAPAYLYVRRDLQSQARQPIWGWFSQRDQFGMDQQYAAADGMARFLTGTPNMLGIASVDEGLNAIADAGIGQIQEGGRLLTGYAQLLADEWLRPLDFAVASPRQPSRRGAHLTLHHEQAWQVCQAMIARDVVPDFRTPDRLRLGFSPLTTSYDEVWRGLDQIRQIVQVGEHLAFPTERAAVT
ncbi:kynureninase [Antricoccus suffuscus]|uniref:Kynureninase n=1 Tax=Antricoccus suffuscus TaxID=1629062 RepID=A0A2T0ZVS4_9ACTN|nr:kynureninase [Antricoccus suffuscus]PRZ40433.1 kynureninase [Antricoccus suffuscus]